jgi:hypothetical protein
MAIKANLVLDQGADFSALIDLTDANGAPYNLVGHTVASQMRKNYASATAAATFICTHNGEIGQINLALPNAQTNDIEPGRYMYDVEITSAGGSTTRVVEGIVTVTPGITRV